MKGCIHFDVEVSSVQQLTALRDKQAQQLRDQGITVTLAASSLIDQPFNLIGVLKTKPSTVWQDTVLAQSQADAIAAALKEDDKRTVVTVDGKPVA